MITYFTARIGQQDKIAPAVDPMMGFGAALQDLGLSAEIGAGGLSNILLEASKATTEYARQIEMTEKELKADQQFANDGVKISVIFNLVMNHTFKDSVHCLTQNIDFSKISLFEFNIRIIRAVSQSKGVQAW